MEDTVIVRFDFSKLDPARHPVCLYLSSTATNVRNRAGGIDVGYSHIGHLHRVRSKCCVVTCYNVVVPYPLRDPPEEQAHAPSQNVKFPSVYTKISLRDWQAWKALSIHEIYAPALPYLRIKLDFPVDLGDYRHLRDPRQSIGVHTVYVSVTSDTGMDTHTQVRADCSEPYAMSFEQLGKDIHGQLQTMFNPVGFDRRRDTIGITVNRWSHGYFYFMNTLYDDEAEGEAPMELARSKVGNVTIANSDAAWDTYAHAAVDQAVRVVRRPG